MRVILVAGALANRPFNGGGAWVRQSWVAGLRRLGFDVYLVEQIAPEACIDRHGNRTRFDGSANLAWFREVTEWFGLAGRAALVATDRGQSIGLPWPRLLEVAEGAELLVNLGGHLTLEPLLRASRRKAYVDLDPGFTQFWHADPANGFRVAGHDFYFTVAENIGAADCPIPLGGIPWRPIRPPVVLDDWPMSPLNRLERFTTVASWRGAFGPIVASGRTYGLKVHEFRKFLAMPRQIENGPRFEIALDIHPGDERDLAALRELGWQVADPRRVAGSPSAFRKYVQDSGAEFSVAQGIYAETNSGWFSDRTVRYLASGKPALVQETGFGRHLPVSEGLLSFRTLTEAVAGARRIMRDYDHHCRAARAIAEQYFASDHVLGRFLAEVGVN